MREKISGYFSLICWPKIYTEISEYVVIAHENITLEYVRVWSFSLYQRWNSERTSVGKSNAPIAHRAEFSDPEMGSIESGWSVRISIISPFISF